MFQTYILLKKNKNLIMNNLFRLKNKKILILGGLGKLGKQFINTFIDYGAEKIIVVDIVEPPKSTKKINYYKCDLSDNVKLNHLFDTILSKEKKIHSLVYNVYSKPKDYYKENINYDLSTWKKVVDVNLTAAYISSQKIIKHFIKKKINGNVVFLSSTYGIVSPNLNIYKNLSKKKNIYGGNFSLTSPAVYTSTKSALLGLTKYLAGEYGKNGIRVNALSPGGVYDKQEEKFVKNYSEKVPLGRMAKWHEYNGAILFLVSDASSYMTGSNLIVDGGWTTW